MKEFAQSVIESYFQAYLAALLQAILAKTEKKLIDRNDYAGPNTSIVPNDETCHKQPR